MSFYDVIESKIVEDSEIVVNLFDHCNLKCSFCPQDHTSKVGASKEEILQKVDPIVKWINNNNKSENFKIHIMGGELFQDEWIEKKFLDIYQFFLSELKSKVKTPKELHINFITNLVFTETNLVLNFLNKNNLKFTVSYDLRGRFNKEQFSIFKQNIEKFKNHISLISLVMTKQNIDAVIKGDEYFEYLYENFNCHWDSFLPSVPDSEKIMPKESEILSFYKTILDKYPKTVNAEYFLQKTKSKNNMACTRGNSFTIMYDGTTPKGCSGALLLKDNQTEDTYGEEIVINFFKKNECFSCEFYSRCPFTCFIQNDYKKMVRDVGSLGKCVFKEVFYYSEEKKNV